MTQRPRPPAQEPGAGELLPPRRRVALVTFIGLAVVVLFAVALYRPSGTAVASGGDTMTAAQVPPTDTPPGVREEVRGVDTALTPEREPLPAVPPPEELDVTRAEMRALGLSLRIDGKRRIQLPIESVFVLPGETVLIEAESRVGGGWSARAQGGRLVPLDPGTWRWEAPREPGVYPLLLTHGESGETVRVQGFVMVPRSEKEGRYLNGYRIGNYPSARLRNDPIYDPPRGFVEVTEENQETPVSPRFRLRHFPAKQGGGFPRYIVLKPELLEKLELLVEALNERGYPVRSLHVMSGYRTPYYNVHRLGNVKYSRHQWGGAADVFVDELPRDDYMDDLNRDGEVNIEDARVLYRVVDSLDRAVDTERLKGGLGIYRANAVRGPFVHLDVRGRPARW